MARPIQETAEDLRRADQLVKRGNEKAVAGVDGLNKAEAAAGTAAGRLKSALAEALEPYEDLRKVATDVSEGARQLGEAARIVDSTDADIARLYDAHLRSQVAGIGSVAAATREQADQKIKAIQNLQAALDSIDQQARAIFTGTAQSLKSTTDGLDALSHALQMKARQLEGVLR